MKLSALITMAKEKDTSTIAVAEASDKEVLEALSMALQLELGEFILFGHKDELDTAIEQYAPELRKHEKVRIKHASSPKAAAEQAVKAVRENEANALMKGNVPTATILKAVLNKEFGLRTGAVLSHVAVFEIPGYDRFTIVTDAAMNIAPTLQEKAQIIQNSVSVARSIGIELPKVAPLSAVEVVNPNMEATIDAASLTAMNRRGQIPNCIVDGPLALDNAVNMEAAKHKGISGEVAGQADILLVPTIETGNILYKSLVYFANAKVGAVIAGAKAPIVLTSRADSAESKLYSMALAICSAK
ncbi:phosphate butyryltransferase [Bacillus coahuilensis m2-6]|uniref:phosphate butyryltransferase n=1 Tax=Bacillus coahuilensis TaxID=408580 RepID=UPI0007501BE0|nr:phosphate butyryltransferase [Bacillus coahuilensis]KUP07347.1 phosphate butyryltransferase [Bacillus coahuilensis m2-6]